MRRSAAVADLPAGSWMDSRLLSIRSACARGEGDANCPPGPTSQGLRLRLGGRLNEPTASSFEVSPGPCSRRPLLDFVPVLTGPPVQAPCPALSPLCPLSGAWSWLLCPLCTPCFSNASMSKSLNTICDLIISKSVHPAKLQMHLQLPP